MGAQVQDALDIPFNLQALVFFICMGHFSHLPTRGGGVRMEKSQMCAEPWKVSDPDEHGELRLWHRAGPAGISKGEHSLYQVAPFFLEDASATMLLLLLVDGLPVWLSLPL